MKKPHKIHDHFFKKVFSNPENAKSFLQIALPDDVKQHIDLGNLSLDPDSYVDEEYRNAFSDIVVKCQTKDENPLDIYLLFEHKSYQDKGIFIQLLKYTYEMFRLDTEAKRPLRVILPLIFYHGKAKWKIPKSFQELFAVPDELKRFMLNFSYIFFDTGNWDLDDPANQSIRQNVFVLTALMLMKSAYGNDLRLIEKVFDLWLEMGFIKETDAVEFFMFYTVRTHEAPPSSFQKLLQEKQIEEESAMPTIAEQWMKEGEEKGKIEGKTEDKQDILLMQLMIRFPAEVTEADQKFIRNVKTPALLDESMKKILDAKDKAEILATLKPGDE